MEASKLNRAKKRRRRRRRIKRVEEVEVEVEVEDEEGRRRRRKERERGEKLFDNLVPVDRVTNGLKLHAVVDDDNSIKS